MQANCCNENMPVINKDVVIVGNGPGGICLSYMLAGNWPYYTGEPHPGDDMLTARLHFSTRSTSTEEDLSNDEEMQEDNNEKENLKKVNNTGRSNKKHHARGLARSTRCCLECLSAGLEGRHGGRPLALLMDQLQHPCVDAGLDLPSLLTWKSPESHPEHKIIDHIVLGKGPPGGAWHSMASNVLTISLSRWMSLPGLDLRHWEMLVEAEQLEKTAALTDRANSTEKLTSCKTSSRVPVGTVAAYYKDYVVRQGLEKYFRCGTTVTSVKPIPGSRDTYDDYGWMVEGYENETGKRFRYKCKRVVLATGTTDLPNRLGIPGENTQPWVTHELSDLERRLNCLAAQHKNFNVNESEGTLDSKIDPVLIVGSGLSAADAVMASRFHGIPVLHAFRDTSNYWNNKDEGKKNIVKSNGYDRLQWLPASIYPEYHKIYEMMGDGGSNYPLYKALPGYTLVDLGPEQVQSERKVTLCAPNGQLCSYHVSIAAILIGSKCDLSYLEGLGTILGRIPGKPIDNKSNPTDIDDFTYEVINSPRKGLYALGPLVGDNFVRFIAGGAFGILAHILSTT